MKRNIRDFLIILASLLDDIAILGLVFLILWLFHVEIQLSTAIVMGLLFIALSFITYKYLVPAYRRQKITGVEGLIGLKGQVVESLSPEGTVKIKDEYWKAQSAYGVIEAGETVEVVGVEGLKLKVKPIEKQG